jgi:hypothetical protein
MCNQYQSLHIVVTIKLIDFQSFKELKQLKELIVKLPFIGLVSKAFIIKVVPKQSVASLQNSKFG